MGGGNNESTSPTSVFLSLTEREEKYIGEVV